MTPITFSIAEQFPELIPYVNRASRRSGSTDYIITEQHSDMFLSLFLTELVACVRGLLRPGAALVPDLDLTICVSGVDALFLRFTLGAFTLCTSVAKRDSGQSSIETYLSAPTGYIFPPLLWGKKMNAHTVMVDYWPIMNSEWSGKRGEKCKVRYNTLFAGVPASSCLAPAEKSARMPPHEALLLFGCYLRKGLQFLLALQHFNRFDHWVDRQEILSLLAGTPWIAYAPLILLPPGENIPRLVVNSQILAQRQKTPTLQIDD